MAAGTVALGDHLHPNRLGFGAMHLTGLSVEAATALLRRAVDLGVQFVDTADFYGPEVSEELVAAALHPYPEGLTVATKGGAVHDRGLGRGAGRAA